ncbi:MAG: PDZ domain-containing protein [Oscillospiraceae bacterium]|nr:PDZ domain-containing protein [Oscillospiraceae bacterium]
MKKWQKVLIFTGTHILVAALSVVLAYGIFLRQTDGMSKLQQLYRLIDDRYVGQYDEQTLFDYAATGMVAGTGDRWSYYVSAKDMNTFNEQRENAYVGVGITISPREDGLGADILRVEPNGSAQEAGIQGGDILYKVEDRLVGEIGVDGASALIAGEPGTQVKITVLREEQELEFTLKRKHIQRAVAQGKMLENNIGYIRIENFNTNCAKHTIEQIKTLVDQGAKGLVFDVRYNGGGYVTEMVEILDYLLPEGDLFVSQYYDGEKYVETSDKNCLELPMMVLVNQDSYSAAEFFAAALREYEWAQVVGLPTVGKSYFQETYEFADGSAVSLSVGKYFTPKGVCLQDEGGLVPDVVVEVDDTTAAAIYAQTIDPKDDPQLCKALELLQ